LKKLLIWEIGELAKNLDRKKCIFGEQEKEGERNIK
jgi:hypothetical protein